MKRYEGAALTSSSSVLKLASASLPSSPREVGSFSRLCWGVTRGEDAPRAAVRGWRGSSSVVPPTPPQHLQAEHPAALWTARRGDSVTGDRDRHWESSAAASLRSRQSLFRSSPNHSCYFLHTGQGRGRTGSPDSWCVAGASRVLEHKPPRLSPATARKLQDGATGRGEGTSASPGR